MTARAKWDAWAQMAKDYAGRAEDAERRYLEIAKSLGWKEGKIIETVSEGSSSSGSRGTGMGVSVSVLSMPPREAEDEAGTLHGFVVENDIKALSAILQSNPSSDVNAKDEYVSAKLRLILHVW